MSHTTTPQCASGVSPGQAHSADHGSAVHVMLALCRSSRQVVVAYEEFDGTDMIGELFGEGQGLAHQAGHALSQRAVKALDMVGFTGQLADRSMLSSGNHPYVYHVLIGIEGGVLTVGFRNLRPQALGTPAAAIPHVKCNHLARGG